MKTSTRIEYNMLFIQTKYLSTGQRKKRRGTVNKIKEEKDCIGFMS